MRKGRRTVSEGKKGRVEDHLYKVLVVSGPTNRVLIELGSILMPAP